MAMSDCPKCWDTPCTCGWGYRWMAREQRLAMSAVVLGVSVEYLRDKVGPVIPEEHPMKEVADD